MPEISFCNSCGACSRPLYGPAKYCPYCGARIEASLFLQEASQREDAGQVIESLSIPSEEPSPGPQGATLFSRPTSRANESAEGAGISAGDNTPEPKSTFVTAGPISEPSTPSSKWKWRAVAIVLVVGLVGYIVFHLNKQSSPSRPSSNRSTVRENSTANQAKRETARVLALEALRQGTALSVTLSKLPKLEKVLRAAQKLQDISPRYQEQVTSAEKTLSGTRTDRDRSVLAYFGKALELGRYSPEQMSYALDVIQNGELTSRERVVAELLAVHVNFLRSGTNHDPARLLSDFTQRFGDFVD